MQTYIREITAQFEQAEFTLSESEKELQNMRSACSDMLKTILWMPDTAKYLPQGEPKVPIAASVRSCDNRGCSVIR